MRCVPKSAKGASGNLSDGATLAPVLPFKENAHDVAMAETFGADR